MTAQRRRRRVAGGECCIRVTIVGWFFPSTPLPDLRGAFRRAGDNFLEPRQALPLWKRWSARIRLLISASPPGQSHRQHAFAPSHQQTGRRDPGGVMPLGRQATLQAALTTFSWGWPTNGPSATTPAWLETSAPPCPVCHLSTQRGRPGSIGEFSRTRGPRRGQHRTRRRRSERLYGTPSQAQVCRVVREVNFAVN